mgnify:CR=1 FL=1
MKKSMVFFVLIWVLVAVTGVSAQGYYNPNITLTQGNLDKCLNTLPGWVKVVKAAGMNSKPSAAGALYQHEKINAYLRSQGWGNPYDYYAVLAKISMAMAWVAIMANPQIPEEQRRQMEPQMQGTVSQLSPAEKALIKKNAKRIFEAMKAASGESE